MAEEAKAEREAEMEEKQVAKRETVLDLDISKMQDGLKKIKQFQSLVQTLTTKDVDYGVIPGTKKPTLLKPGAEKIAKLMGLCDQYEILKEEENYKEKFFAYTFKCKLVSISSGALISEGVGSCNSWESKYKYRWVYSSQLPPEYKDIETRKDLVTRWRGKIPQYRLENEDIYSQVNTILKMAKKRSLIDAVLSAGRLSEVFTQDLEDVPVETEEAPKADPIVEKAKEVFAGGGEENPAKGDLSEVFHFGKYKGKSFEEVYKENQGYLEWCEKKLQNEELRAKIKDFLDKKAEQGWNEGGEEETDVEPY
jgi:hypothetical protein